MNNGQSIRDQVIDKIKDRTSINNDESLYWYCCWVVHQNANHDGAWFGPWENSTWKVEELERAMRGTTFNIALPEFPRFYELNPVQPEIGFNRTFTLAEEHRKPCVETHLFHGDWDQSQMWDTMINYCQMVATIRHGARGRPDEFNFAVQEATLMENFAAMRTDGVAYIFGHNPSQKSPTGLEPLQDFSKIATLINHCSPDVDTITISREIRPAYQLIVIAQGECPEVQISAGMDGLKDFLTVFPDADPSTVI